jgi:hypothetical protein
MMKNKNIIQSNNVEFREIPIKGKPVYKIFYTLENGRSKVMESFIKLPKVKREEIISIMQKMAKNEDYKSQKVRRIMQAKYDYGEVKPHGHRFFYFIKCGKNYVYFKYLSKKADSLKDEIYKKIQKEMDYYAEEFEKYIQGN